MDSCHHLFGITKAIGCPSLCDLLIYLQMSAGAMFAPSVDISRPTSLESLPYDLVLLVGLFLNLKDIHSLHVVGFAILEIITFSFTFLLLKDMSNAS